MWVFPPIFSHGSKSSSNVNWLFCLWLSPRQHIRHFIDNYQIYIQNSNKEESVKLCEKTFGISLILFSSISFQSRYLLSFKVATHQEVMRLSSGKRWSQSPGNQPWSGTGKNACLSLRNCLRLFSKGWNLGTKSVELQKWVSFHHTRCVPPEIEFKRFLRKSCIFFCINFAKLELLLSFG